jgi:hypothetical protein
MIHESDILNQLSKLDSAQVSLTEFERWIGSASWNMHKDSDPRAVELASAILFLFSRYGDGELDGKQLRMELANAAHPFTSKKVQTT